MASAKFLEEALSTDVDESAVNAIVGSLETQLVTNSPALPGTHITSSASNQNSVISNGGPPIPVQKHSVANGETVNVLFNADANKCISTNSLHSSVVNTNATHTAATAQGIVQNTYVNQTGSSLTQTNTQKGSDNVKLVYQQGNQVINNRVYPAQSVQNGLAPLTQQNVLQTTQSAVNKTQSSIVIKSTNANPGSAGIVSVPLNTNPGMSHMTVSNATVPTVMTLGKQVASGQQTLVGGAPLVSGNVQILNMRPGVPVNQAQKSIATMAPRVVIGGPQMVRPGTPGQITLQTLQGLQPGQQGHLLLKTENGQYQLLRVGPAPTQTPSTAVASMAQATTASTALRLQQTSTVSRLATRKTIVQQVKLGTNVQGTNVSSATITGSTSTVPITGTPVSAPVTHIVNQQVVTNQEAVKSNAPLVTTQPGVVRNSVDNTKEKCRKFLANLLELSSREPKTVERNVRTLIQELIDSRVEPEEFCERLERLLNASPQPCLIGFLKKSLPLLRQSLLVKELVIEGIKPPPANVVYSTATVPQQVQHTVQSQVRLVHPANVAGATIPNTVRPTTVQQPRVVGPRAQIRTSTAVMRAQQIQQTTNSTISSTNPPALHPVSIGGAQYSTTQQVRLPNAIRTGANIIRGVSPARLMTPAANNKTGTNMMSGTANAATIRGAIQNAANKAIGLATGTIGANKQTAFVGNKTIINSVNNMSQLSRPKEKKSFISAAAYAGDDDINDVAAMGGVNLAEETQRILGSTEMIGTQIRSCKDEIFLHSAPLQAKIRQIVARHGLDEPSPEIMALISHATQERLKNIVEKLAVIAEHRIDVIKMDPRYETTQDVKGQLKFLEELDRAERKRHDEQEREMLLRAAKSRSKSEDPEQAKLKAKAKEMQRAEMEELRQREANLTALQAIGPRKKARMEEPASSLQVGGSGNAFSGRSITTFRPRLKRVNLRDMLFLLEQEKNTSRSSILCKSYLK